MLTGIIMKEQMNNIYLKVLILITMLMLQACGSSTDNTVYTISADIAEISFSNEVAQGSTDTIAIKVTFDGEGLLVGFPPEIEPAWWLSYRSENVTATSAAVYIDVINAEFLAPDQHSTTIRLATTNKDGSTFTSLEIDVSLLVWDLTADTEQVNYSATFGDTSVASQAIEITSEANEWTASTDVDWLSLDITSGTGNGNGTITATPILSTFTASGLQQANIILTEVTSGDTKAIPVELALDNIYLYSDTPTIAFTSTNNISAIEKTIFIGNNGESQPSWQAYSEAEWLTLTPIGDSQLQITANANVATIGETSSASIVITTSDESIAVNEIINVNFYNANLSVENKLLEPLVVNDDAFVASPSLPKFYISANNALQTYHQYTGELENSLIVSPEGTVLEQLIIHPAGDYLLAKALETVTNEDESTSITTHRYRINLSDNTVTEIELTDTTIEYEPMAIIRFSGRYFIISQTLEFANEDLQSLFWDAVNGYSATSIDMATQTSTLFALDNSTVSIKRYTAQINDFGANNITATLTHDYHPESLADGQFINDFIVTNDEKNIYAISDTSEWISFDGTSFVDNGLLETNENVATLKLEKNSDSKANYLRIDTSNQLRFYLDTYNDQQTIATTVYTNGNQPSSIQLSADDQRLIINANMNGTPESEARVELVTLLLE